MALYHGEQTRVSWLKESGTFATISGGNHWLGQVTEATPDEDQGIFEQMYVGGGQRTIQQFVPGPQNNQFSVTYRPQDWRMLAYMFGNVVNATVSGTEQHTLSILNLTGTLPSFAVELGKIGAGTNQSTTYKGVVMNGFELTWSQGEQVSVKLDLVAKTASGGTGVSSVTSGTIAPFNWSDGGKGLEVSGTALGLTGKVNELKSISYRLNQNLDLDTFYIQEVRERGKPVPTNFGIELDATVNMSEGTGANITNTYRNGSEFNCSLWITRLGSSFTATGTQGSKNFVEFWLSGCVFTDESNAFTTQGATEQNFTLKPKTAGAVVGDAFPAGSWNTFF